jgi:hypothetical protein
MFESPYMEGTITKQTVAASPELSVSYMEGTVTKQTVAASLGIFSPIYGKSDYKASGRKFLSTLKSYGWKEPLQSKAPVAASLEHSFQFSRFTNPSLLVT